MPGGFSTGFSTGFGPFAASGVLDTALFAYLNIINKQEKVMETTIINGAGASTTIVPGPAQGVQLLGIQLDVPLDEVGTTDPVVTVSGSISGAYSFHSSVSPKLRFYVDEQIAVTTTDFSAEYTAILSYVLYGDQQYWKDTRNISKLPLPSRLVRNPRNGS